MIQDMFTVPRGCSMGGEGVPWESLELWSSLLPASDVVETQFWARFRGGDDSEDDGEDDGLESPLRLLQSTHQLNINSPLKTISKADYRYSSRYPQNPSYFKPCLSFKIILIGGALPSISLPTERNLLPKSSS